MLPEDSIFNVILTHRHPVSRNEQPIKKFLSEYYDEYIRTLKEALAKPLKCSLRNECYSLLEQKLPIITELCDDIIKIFELYDLAHLQLLYSNFDKMMEKIEDYLFTEEIGPIGYLNYRNLFRIRPGVSKYSRLDMFHISMDNRQLIKSYRYSIPGYPCLYLSNGLELCWFECGMPKKFSYSVFALNVTNEKQLRLINFTHKPVDLISSVVSWYYNYPDLKEEIDLYLIKYLIIHPIKTACSVQVADRDNAFIQEYIFPQLLLLWVREHNKFDGIAYITSSAVEKAREWNFFNVVLPAKLISNGYCDKLRDLFTVTKPVKVELSNLFEKRRCDINKVINFVKKLENKYYNGYLLYPYREMLSLCKTFLLLYEALCFDNYKNGEIIYQAIDSLNLMAYLVNDNIYSLKTKAIDQAKILFYDVDLSIIETEFDDVFNDFKENVKPILFDFWGYALRISSDADIDLTTFEPVL